MTTNLLPAIVVNDSTLRDADRSPRVAPSRSQRVGIALALERAGVDEIEFAVAAGAQGGTDDIAPAAQALSRARAIAWGPMRIGTVDAAIRAGFGAVHLAVPLAGRSGGRTALTGRIMRVVDHARAGGLRACVAGENASGADFGFVCDVMATAEAAGAHRFRYADTKGVLRPLQTHRLFRELCAETDLELEFHGHDDLGRATANTFAAVQGGATHVSVSLLRFGRRSATARLDRVVNAIRLSPQHHTHVVPGRLPAVLDLLTAATGVSLEDGIHWNDVQSPAVGNSLRAGPMPRATDAANAIAPAAE